MKKYVEFVYQEENERKFREQKSIYKIIEELFESIRCEDKLINHKIDGDIFDKEIAFKISKEIIPAYWSDVGLLFKDQSERLILETIPIQKIKLDIPDIKLKYNLKDRIKILFKGKI